MLIELQLWVSFSAQMHRMWLFCVYGETSLGYHLFLLCIKSSGLPYYMYEQAGYCVRNCANTTRGGGALVFPWFTLSVTILDKQVYPSIFNMGFESIP